MILLNAKYPTKDLQTCDLHSCGHRAYERYALVVSRLNKKPVGSQPATRDILWERSCQNLGQADMYIIPAQHEHYKNGRRPHRFVHAQVTL